MKILIAGAVTALLFAPAAANAKACRDTHGQFSKCPPSSAPAAPRTATATAPAGAAAARCRDAKGHFVRCGAPAAPAAKSAPAPAGGGIVDRVFRPKAPGRANVAPSSATPPRAAPAGGGAAAAGATAQCRHGTYSHSQHRSGTCSHHGGVSQWLR